MLKKINIASLVQAYSSLTKGGYEKLLNHHGIQMRNKEVDDLRKLVDAIRGSVPEKYIFDDFFVGYKIPQIGKEFDLLRVGRKTIVNVEIKKKSTPDKIKKQLLRNKYYLSFIQKQAYLFCFSSDDEKLYSIDSKNELLTFEISHLTKVLVSQEKDGIGCLDDLFDPSSYLVSPFNSTEAFLNGEYFLTHQQEDIKSQLISKFSGASSEVFFSITGNAGTGKTLLIYDIVKDFILNDKKALVIHCGNLNDGQLALKEAGWDIYAIKHLYQCCISEYDLIIVDEAQRIYPKQFAQITEAVADSDTCCIFSYDQAQTLANSEIRNNIAEKIGSLPSLVRYKLSKKIRTNKEVADFVRQLFDKNLTIESSRTNAIDIHYFDNTEDAKYFADNLCETTWEVLRFTPSQYNTEHHEKYSKPSSKTSHRVIGQEFDNVAVVIDEYFYYADNGKLAYRGYPHYHPVKMLFQNVTRTRKRLGIVIIDNHELLDRCLSVVANT
jgi:Cdc6-like AAA superfamily ATPase